MYNALTSAIKSRIILELRRFWQYDPNYPDLPQHIQGKYSFRERPQQGIIVKGSSANTVQLSADNFQGTVNSYVYLQKVKSPSDQPEYPGLSIEWVREDGRAIQRNGGRMPSPPGIYYIAVERENVEIQGQNYSDALVFYVDPLLKRIDEAPVQTGPLTWQVAHTPIHPGSLRVWELPGNIQLLEGPNYTVDNDTGVITLINPLPARVQLSVDYNYTGTSLGPYLIKENYSNVRAIPGVVLAFGRRVTAGDRLAVILSDRRSPVALEYGGRWEINLDLDVMARDVVAQGEIADRSMLYLWGIARNRLSTEGIEITQVNFTGESEEIYDDAADDYFYNGALSITLQSDWSVHVPLDPTIGRVSPQTVVQAAAAANMTDDQLLDNEQQNLQMVQDPRMLMIRDPFFLGRNANYEVIK